MKFLLTQNIFISKLGILSVFLISGFWVFGAATAVFAQEAGDGVYFYGVDGDTMPYVKMYENSSNTFSATTTTIASGTAIVSVIKSSPIKKEMIAGYVNASGILHIVCFDGTSWTNEWSANVGGTGNTRRFDIGYETATGDVMVLYSANAATTNELRYRTKSGGVGCGSSNWSSQTDLDPVRTSGIVQWVKIAEDRRSGSNLLTAIWADAGRDLSAMVWSGTAWGNEHTALLENNLEIISDVNNQEIESFDVVYESLSGDVMVTWGSAGSNGSNGAWYGVCTGGTASCTWSDIRTAMPSFLDDASTISIAADPLSDQIVFASIGNGGSDLQIGIWSGTAWTNTPNVDTSAFTPAAGRQFVATGWLNNGDIKRAVITYYDSAGGNVDWYTASGTTIVSQSDFTVSTALGTRTQYKIVTNPHDSSELMFTTSNSIRRGFAKRLRMDSDGVFTWTNSDGGLLAGPLASTIYRSADFAYWNSLAEPVSEAPVNLSGVLYINQGGTVPAGSGKTIKLAVGTSTPSVFSTTTNSNGEWNFFDIAMTGITGTTSVTFYLDGDTSKATTIMSPSWSGGGLGAIPLYYNTLVVYEPKNNGIISLENFYAYDSTDDSDILYTASSTEMVVHGDFVIERGVVVAPDSLILRGSYTNNASFTKGDETVFRSYLGNFLSGRDTNGSATGTSNLDINDIAVSGNYLYAAKNGNGTACSQVAGSAVGCELLVFDISDPENPVYVAGRDSNGSANGATAVDAFRLHIVGDYLYVGGNFSNTACNGTPGNAIGCELKVYDISIPTNPRLVAGRDGSGSSTGTAFSAVSAFASTAGYLFVGKGNDDSVACSQSVGSAQGCEIMVFDISNPANPVYVAGRDADGAAAGTKGVIVYDLEYHEGYLYVAKDFNTTTCSQSAGSAEGCEIMVFNVTTPTNPIYVAGRDDDGSPTDGDGQSNSVTALVAHGDYLYVGKFDFFAPACGQTAGSGGGCELTVYDISTPASISYVAGRDANGSASGAASGHIISLTRIGDVLYGVKSGNATACNPTIGNAAGCELVAFDISSGTNPVLMDARDISGSRGGTVSKDGRKVVAADGVLFVSTVNNTTACSQTPGDAIGCELLAFQAVPSVEGNVLGSNNLGNVTIEAVGASFVADSEVDNLTISEGYLSAPDLLVVNGDYLNDGLLQPNTGRIRMAGTNKTIDGFVTGANAFYGLEVSGSYEFVSTHASTTNLTILAGGELTAPSVLSVERRMHSDGTFVHNNGVVHLGHDDESLGKYVTARSRDGSAGINDYGIFYGSRAFIQIGNYLYAGGRGYDTACSQVSGSAEGCEIVVFDNSDPTNPVLVYSLAGDGSPSGVTETEVLAFALSGTTLYVGKHAESPACSQTAGSAAGCELMVFDVSNPAVPVFRAGRDASGNNTGTASVNINTLAVRGNYLYVGKEGNSTACSQSAGSARGCELMVFDISSTTNPTYVAGRDADASTTGTTGGDNALIRDLLVIDTFLYMVKQTGGNSCAPTAGNASGCALLIYDISDGANPVLVTTRTTDGLSTSEDYSWGGMRAMSQIDNVLYVGANGGGGRCPQALGDGRGNACEIHIYDVSSSSNPVYIGGMDASGSRFGGADSDAANIEDMVVANGYLYVVKDNLRDPCRPVPGQGFGCTFQIYDISSTTNPLLMTMVDEQGSFGPERNIYYDGTYAVAVHNGYVYVSNDEQGQLCVNQAGSAIGCGIKVYDGRSGGLLTGSFVGASALNDVVAKGTTVFAGAASTSNLYLQGDYFSQHTNNFYLQADYLLERSTDISVGGDLVKSSGVSYFDRDANLYFSSNNAQTISGGFNGLSALPNTYFTGSGLKTVLQSASTSDLLIAAGSLVAFESALEVAGTLGNQGTMTTEAELFLQGLYQNFGAVSIEASTKLQSSPISHIVAAINTSGSETGFSRVGYHDFELVGDYLYTAGSDGPCFAPPGAHSGCLLSVYDVSNPYNPTYVAGRDADGDVGGGYSFAPAFALAAQGNYLYVGKQFSYDDCATYGAGCQVQVYDISSSTNPVYVAGRNSRGNTSGGGDQSVYAVAVSGNYLYVGKERNDTACSQSAGSADGCELMVFDISTPTNPTYVAGRDVSGSAAGTGNADIYSLAISGNYLYVGKEGNGTACSQSAGSAVGCELMVFDISTPTNPTYVAGRDSGQWTATGSEGFRVVDLQIVSDTLYVLKEHGYENCTEGDIYGCHISVLDISTPTTPTYVGGTSFSGPLNQPTAAFANKLFPYGERLYVTKGYANGLGCDTSSPNTSVEGCELMVFDISSTTNPVYLDAIDSSGSKAGTGTIGFGPLAIRDDYLFVGVTPDSYTDFHTRTCTPTTGKTEGCELQVYRTKPIFEGDMTGGNAFQNLEITGSGVTFVDNATVGSFVLEDGEVIAPAVLTVGGDFINNALGSFNANGGEVVLSGSGQNVVGTTTFYNLTKQATGAATTTFEAGSLTTVANEWNFSGASAGVPHVLRSSVNGQYWYINASTTNVSNLAVRDSNNLNVTTVICGSGCIDNTNNVNWSFESVSELLLESSASYVFYPGQATTTLETVTITEGGPATITTTNDIRITIATTTTNFRFDTGTTELTFGGTAAGKVANTVSYENGGATLVLNVTTNFAPEDTLTIDGIAVGSFVMGSGGTSAFALHTNGSIAGTPAAVDSQTIRIAGALLVSDHGVGQAVNQFSAQNKTNEVFFAFTLESVGEDITVQDLTLTLTGIQLLDTSDLLNFRLYRDNNGNRAFDGGDTLIDSDGILTMNGQLGAVTFSTNFAASTSAEYLIVADTHSITLGAQVNFIFTNTVLAATGDITGISSPLVLNVSSIQHIRLNAGARPSGGSSRAGGATPPPGASTETGGGAGAGPGAEQTDGENITPSANFYKPTSTGSPHNEWTNGSNALQSDGTYASASSNNLRQSYAGFPFAIPEGNTIQGIGIKIDASGSTAAGAIDVAISWDGGESYTTGKATPTLSGSDIVYTVGGAADLWGRAWNISDFAPELFRIRVTAATDSNTLRLDALEVRVYHQTSGGGSGGGGGGGRS